MKVGTAVNHKGNTYGLLTVIEATNKRGHGGSIIWKCKCQCGNIVEVESREIRTRKSCGCLRKARSLDFGERMMKHSESHTRLYGIWSNIKNRCCNPNDKRYKDYGGRGVQICDEWANSYTCFANWAKAHGYNEKLSIDRIDNNGNYNPQNCKWSTSKEQAVNKRSNKIITFKGKTMTMKEWADEVRLPYGCLQTRMIRGWTEEEALTTPIQQHRKKVK